MPGTSGRSAGRGLAVACVVSVVVAVALAWPLPFHLRTAIPATPRETDVATYIWNYWWVRHAVVDLHASPLATDRIIAPFGADLRLHTLGLLDALAALPLCGALGPVAALNGCIVLTFALNGVCAFLLARRALGSTRAAILAGVLVEVSPTSGFHMIVGRPFLGSVWAVALALLFLLRLADTRRWHDAAAFGAALLAALLLDFQVLLFTTLWIAVVAVWLAATRRADVLSPRFLVYAGAGVLIPALPFTAIWLRPLLSAAARGYPVPSVADTLVYSMKFSDAVTLTIMRSTFGLLPPLLALAALWVAARDRTPRVWLFGGALFSVLVLGAYLKPTKIPLPYLALRWLPGLDQFRTPYRFAVPASLGIAIAGAWAVEVATVRLPRAWLRRGALAAAAVCAFADARILAWPPAPFLAHEYPRPAVYRAIAADPRDGLVLEVPAGFRSGVERFGNDQADILVFHQAVHGKRLINGMVARLPSTIFAYYRGSPALRLLAGEALPVDGAARADLDAKIAELGVRWIVLHRDMLDAAAAGRVEALLEGRADFAPMESAPPVAAWRRVD